MFLPPSFSQNKPPKKINRKEIKDPYYLSTPHTPRRFFPSPRHGTFPLNPPSSFFHKPQLFIMNLMEPPMVDAGEGPPPPPHPHAPPPQAPPPATYAPEKVPQPVDEFTDTFRDLRETANMSRDDETRCIMRTLSVLLQVAADSRSHVQSINTRLDEMVSSTKDLRQRTVEVLATVEKENCLNIPQVLWLILLSLLLSFLFFLLSSSHPTPSFFFIVGHQK